MHIYTEYILVAESFFREFECFFLDLEQRVKDVSLPSSCADNGPRLRSGLAQVVIDVPNVAMRHGLNKKFSCKGVQMAIEYFRTAGHRVLG